MHAHTHTPKEVTQKEKRKESMHINKKKIKKTQMNITRVQRQTKELLTLENNKMTIVNPTLSVITLNGLNSPIQT